MLNLPKFTRQLVRRGLRVADLFDGYAALAGHVIPAETQRVCRDPDDDHVLACALAARAADAVVSGDGDLLTLGSHQGIPILTAAQALQKLRSGA